MVDADLPGLDEQVGAAIGTVFHAATAWIVGYWTRHRGRDPGPAESEPLTRACSEAGRLVSAADYLLTVGDLQASSRSVAQFLVGVERAELPPWFGVWSRDTMTSYEGFFLATGRPEESRALLRPTRRPCRRGCSSTPPTGCSPRDSPDTR